MFERAQSESVGVILLTAVITLTVTGAGAVVLTEWQADLEQGPIADIESDATPINVTLDHRGGDTLSPNETTIRLVGVDENISLESPLAPGTSSNETFDDPILDGQFELLVIHDPTETVVHSETYDFDSTADRLVFEIANESDPAYVLKDNPANYTVKEVFEFGDREINRTVTNEANITVEDSSKLSVDEGASTITGTEADTVVNATAEVDDATNETEIIILENPPVLEVETHDASTTGPTSIEAKGELTDMGRLPEVDLLFETIPYRAFNNDSEDNGDNIIASGEWRTDPAGYTHAGRYVHDNKPLVEGETRTYYYNNSAGVGGNYLWHLRDAPEDSGSMYHDYYRGGYYYGDWPDSGFRIEVTLSEDGSTVDVVSYKDVTGDDVHIADRGVSTRNGDVYFTTHTSGTSGENSIRLTDIREPGEAELTEAETDVTKEKNYSAEITGLNVDQTYSARAYARAEIGGETVTATGDRLTNSTESQVVETVGAPPASGTRINSTGRLVDIGSLDSTDLLFEYIPHRFFNKDSNDNGDNITASGVWRTDPTGYTHAGRYVHDNKPLVEGETRTYYYNNSAGVGGNYLWHLRDAPEDSGSMYHDYYRGGYYYGDWPDGGFRIEVTLSEDGSTVDVISYKNMTGDDVHIADTDVSTRSGDVYFTTHTSGTSGENSIRLTDIYDTAEIEFVTAERDVTEPTGYNTNITGLRPGRNYTVRAYAEEMVNGTEIVDTGERYTTYLNGPSITTLQANATGGTSVEAEGELVDLGDLHQTDLWFETVPYRAFNKDREDNGDNVTTDGEWRTDPEGYTHDSDFIHDNRPLVGGETRTYYYYNPGINAGYLWYLRDAEEETGYVGSDYHRGGAWYHDFPQGEFRIEVTLSEDESTVDVILYENATGDETDFVETDVPTRSGNVYFSTHPYGGATDSDSIRLTDIYEPSDSEQHEAKTGVTGSTNYSAEINNLKPDHKYAIRAYSERIADNVTITDSGAEVTARTETATVETVSAHPNGNRIEAEGELVDIGALQETNLSFEYTPYRKFNELETDNGDNVTTDGEWRTDPEGYTHDSDFIHDNRPLVGGETRTYYYYNPGINAGYLWYLRDAEEETGYVGSDYYRGGAWYHDFPQGEFRIEVTLSEDESTVDVILYENAIGDETDFVETDVPTRSGNVYFSTEPYGGAIGSDSIRLTDIYEASETQRVDVETGVTENTTYSTDILAEFERNYTVRTYAERRVDNTTIVNTGDKVEVQTEGPGGVP
ncbi:hypothetical protein [Halohasta salina]|uniref:hypothetical protein n=1 Tax=Halohasta salina TaxID=2961621 RepID=UPI0020A2B8ED|nr:hypothetical protein [Halohasta salina]